MNVQTDVCRHIARQTLKGRWWKTAMTGLWAAILGVFTNLFDGAFKLILMVFIIVGCFEGVPFYREIAIFAGIMISLIWLFVGSFARLGYMNYNLAMLDGRRESGGMVLGASSSWWNGVELRIVVLCLTCFASIFFLIPGIVVYCNYAMAPFLLEQKADITVKEAMKMSHQKMKGNRMKYCSLQLSFIGWRILSWLTLGLGYFFVNPYWSLSETVFFNEISGRADELYDR